MRVTPQFAPVRSSWLRVWTPIRLAALCSVLLLVSHLSAQESLPDAPVPNLPSPSQPAVDAPAPPVASDPSSPTTPPVAIVALDQTVRGAALSVAGSMQAKNGRAFITGSGSVTAGGATADVTLPYRGTLHVCASTTLNLAADTSAPPGGAPGLLMAMDHGAVEMSFANTPAGANADTLMTPDFRILIGGPGASELKVRLGNGGDTCIDNGAHEDGTTAEGLNAPYVIVTSLFDASFYRVQPGQRVLLQHGSVNEIVDQEKEPCGCPPQPAQINGNEFPLAQSEGLVPLTPVEPPPNSDQVTGPQQVGEIVPPLVYPQKKKEPPAIAPTAMQPASDPLTPASQPTPSSTTKAAKKSGLFRKIGHVLRDIFWNQPQNR